MIYKNAYVYTKDRRFEYGSFSVRDGRFAPAEEAAGEAEVDLRGNFVIPGLIDIHTHGCAGADFSDGDPEGLRRMGDYYARHGVTSFAPTSMTLPYEQLERAFAAAVSYRNWPVSREARGLFPEAFDRLCDGTSLIGYEILVPAGKTLELTTTLKRIK